MNSIFNFFSYLEKKKKLAFKIGRGKRKVKRIK